jgi:hypothetical protein
MSVKWFSSIAGTKAYGVAKNAQISIFLKYLLQNILLTFTKLFYVIHQQKIVNTLKRLKPAIFMLGVKYVKMKHLFYLI